MGPVNSWIIYQQLGSNTIVDFLGKKCFSLIKRCVEVNDEVVTPNPICQSLSANDIPYDVQYNRCSHWPVLIDIPNSLSCKAEDCKKKTNFQSYKCHVYLCIASNTCFLNAMEFCDKETVGVYKGWRTNVCNPF